MKLSGMYIHTWNTYQFIIANELVYPISNFDWMNRCRIWQIFEITIYQLIGLTICCGSQSINMNRKWNTFMVEVNAFFYRAVKWKQKTNWTEERVPFLKEKYDTILPDFVRMLFIYGILSERLVSLSKKERG